jgi:hypothetical protein
MNSDRVIVEALKVAQVLLCQKFTSQAQPYGCCNRFTIARTHRLAFHPISLGAQQRRAYHVCITSGRARAFGLIAVASRHHQ